MGFIPGKPRVCEMTTTFLKLAARLDAQNHDSSKEVTEFLEEFYNWWSDPAFIPRCIPPTRAEWREASLLIATWLGTFNCVDAYLRGGGISSRSVFLSTTLLPAALGLGDVSHSYHIRKVFSPDRHQLEPKLVQKLFAHGTDPFQLLGGGNNTTVFDAFLSKIKVMARSQCSDSLLIKWSHTLQALLQYPSQSIFHQTPSRCSDWKHDITRISSSLTSLIDNVYAKTPKGSICIAQIAIFNWKTKAGER
jgi:hypothetical protein